MPDGDFIAQPDAPMYYISVDPSGRLGWESSTLTYETTTAHVVEVLTEKASNAYKAFLRTLGISYLIAGEQALDYGLLIEKLSSLLTRGIAHNKGQKTTVKLPLCLSESFASSA